MPTVTLNGFDVEAEFGQTILDESPELLGLGIMSVDVQPEIPSLVCVGMLVAKVEQIFTTPTSHVQPIDSEVVWSDV